MLGHFLCPVLGVRGVNSVNYNLSLLPITTISALESASQGYFVIFHIGTVLAMKNTVELEDGFPAKLFGLTKK